MKSCEWLNVLGSDAQVCRNIISSRGWNQLNSNSCHWASGENTLGSDSDSLHIIDTSRSQSPGFLRDSSIYILIQVLDEKRRESSEKERLTLRPPPFGSGDEGRFDPPLVWAAVIWASTSVRRCSPSFFTTSLKHFFWFVAPWWLVNIWIPTYTPSLYFSEKKSSFPLVSGPPTVARPSPPVIIKGRFTESNQPAAICICVILIRRKKRKEEIE